MQTSDFVLVRGLADTRATLHTWNQRPGPVVGRWVAGSLAITVLLLLAVWVVSIAPVAEPDPTEAFIPIFSEPTIDSVLHVLGRNSLVLALHAFACIAGFIAGSSLPQEAERYSGAWRWIHDKAGPMAIAFVIAATGFSLVTQAYILGQGASSLAWRLDISSGTLLLGLLPHALPELMALFLPLAAWMIASRQKDWHELMAATLVTVVLAAPVLVAASFIEVYVTPSLLRSLGG
ncbi:MAG TPA: stage II sporulation protein M [Solirubrobacteraceae bacterium]|nr:stage II sporulation protein M [Solirubrobacteraceae bacterium]